jgi:hypothetical protein
MDRVRFGRALGTGARDAARAVLKAADAATAPNPAAPPARPSAAQPPSAPSVPPDRVAAHPDRVAATVQQVRATTHGIKRGSRLFGRAIWGPFAKVSTVVWHEVTGFVCALFAVAAAGQIWLHRADLQTRGAAHNNLLAATGLFLLFTYLTLSSYLRARRRNRRS